MNKIYADTTTCQWHLTRLNLNNIEICSDLNESTQIAVFHIPYPVESDPEFRSRLNQAVKVCKKVIVLMSELHLDTVDFLTQHQHPKITYFICGKIDRINSKLWLDWLDRTSIFYKKHPEVLSKLRPYAIKEKTFDILLGRCKPHRTAVYNFINENSLNDQVIMTYLKGNDTLSLKEQDTNGWIWEDDGLVLPNHNFNWTVTPVQYHGYNMSLSQIVPISIYNQTAYSIVAETNNDNNYSFFTEKIVKPILARRLFIAAGGQYYLRNLRSLGFKTFDGIIDESYDTVADPAQRATLINEQIAYLISQDQQTVLAKAKPIVDHNYRVILGTDWYGNFAKEFRAVLLDHVGQN